MGLGDLNLVLLLVALVRVGIYSFGASVFIRRRRVIGSLGFGLATVNSFVFSFVQAGATLPSVVTDLSTLVATPIVALMISAIVLGTTDLDRRDRWRP